ncbi:MAG: hypothetical protein KGP10_07775 [Actinomycetales bacterium]|nr:hypothetical protein [Actinomycetales bacterium]
MTTAVRVLAVARPTFDTEAAERLRAAAIATLADCTVVTEVRGGSALVMTPADVAAAMAEQPVSMPEVRDVLLCASFCDATPAVALFTGAESGFTGAESGFTGAESPPGSALPPVILWSFPEPGAPGERLLLNSLCGANLAAHALRQRGRQVRHVHGDPADRRVQAELAAALSDTSSTAPPVRGTSGPVDLIAGADALGHLSGQRIGLVGDAPPGFTPCEEPPASVTAMFGLSIDHLDLPTLFERIASVPSDRRDREHARALAEQPSLAAVPQGEALTVAGTTVALADYLTERGCDALALRCWPDFAVDLGACPCSALSRLADRGTPTACERDVLGSLTLLTLAALGAGDAHIVDTVEFEVDPSGSGGLIRVWHCGSAATALAAEPQSATQWLHCNRRLGVAGNFALRTGPVILVRFDCDPEPVDGAPNHPEHGGAGHGGAGHGGAGHGGAGSIEVAPRLRLLLAAGESVPADNRFQGTTATIRVPDPKGLVDLLITGGFPHHTVLAWRDVRPGLRGLAQLLGIPVIDLDTSPHPGIDPA